MMRVALRRSWARDVCMSGERGVPAPMWWRAVCWSRAMMVMQSGVAYCCLERSTHRVCMIL